MKLTQKQLENLSQIQQNRQTIEDNRSFSRSLSQQNSGILPAESKRHNRSIMSDLREENQKLERENNRLEKETPIEIIG
jgi:hypothetical protein